MNIPTANIVVSFSKEAINKLFAQGATFENLIKGVTDNKDVLLFNHESNPNFIDFKHEFGVGHKGNMMTLTLIDPYSEFEERFMTGNFVEMLAGSLTPSTKGKQKNILTKIKEEEYKIETEKKKLKEYAGEFQKTFQKAYGANYVYIAYGVGKNLDLWSGPHIMQLFGADIQVKGARKLVLKFAAIPLPFNLEDRRGLFNEQVNIDLEGLDVEVDVHSDLIDFTNIGTDKPVYAADAHAKIAETQYSPNLTYHREEFFEFLKIANLENVETVVESIDVHMLVTDIIRRYISAATSTPNVIVLLPDLNLICREAIEEIGKVERLNVDEKFILKQEYVGSSNFLSVGGILLDKRAGFYGSNAHIGKFFNTVKAVVHRFCLSLDSRLKNTKEWNKNFDPPMLEFLKEQDSAINFEDRLKLFINHRMFFASKTSRSSLGYPNYSKELNSIEKNILACSKGIYGPKLGFFYESDSKIIEYWSNSNFKNLPLFGGVGTTIKADLPVIVYGDTQLIRNYLYGAANLEEDAKEEAFFAKKVSIANEQVETDALAFLSSSNQPAATVQNFIDNLIIDKKTILAKKLLRTPLHPHDKIVLTDITYNKEVNAIIRPPVNRVGSFGDISYTPDEFGYVDEALDPEAKQLIKEGVIPVFRYNTTNPNILSMKFKYAPIYFSQLKQGIIKEVNRRASTTLAGVMKTKYVDFDFEDAHAVINYIRTRHYSLGGGEKAEEQIKLELAAEFEAQTIVKKDAEAAAEFAYKTYSEILDHPEKPIIKVDQLLPGNPITIMSNFSEQMYRNALQMSIETLPLFHISKHTGTLTSPCLVFAQDQDIMKTKKLKRSLLNNFFSGAYQIMSFSHKISAKGASSSFSLMKAIPRISPSETQSSDSLELSK